MSTGVGMKGEKGSIDIRFFSKRIGPKIMCVIINEYEIIDEARIAWYWRCPEVTM